MIDFSQFPRAGFTKRLMSMVYDLLVAVAIYMLAGLISFILFMVLFENGIIDNAGYEHASDLWSANLFYKYTTTSFNLICVAFCFMWFWTHGGQTMGMRPWRLKIQNADGSSISWAQAFRRLLGSLLGLGNLLVLFDRKNQLSLADRASGSVTVLLSKEANRHINWHHV